MAIRGTASDDMMTANPGNELRGLEGNDTLIGSTGNERLLGGDGNDVLIGNAGDDYLDGGSGVDSMDGGVGNDSYIVDNAGDTINDPDEGRISAYANFNMATNVSGGATKLTLSLRADGITGTGSANDDLIVGYASNTTLIGGDGNDILKGANSSTVRGGNGNDILEITSFGIGNLIGGAGNDRYNVYQIGNILIDELSDGGSGIDTVFTSLNLNLNGQSGITFQG